MSLFPHRYDFLYAESIPGERPQWKTEHRYPLSDRLIQQGDRFWGVRFGAETRYVMLDIDAGSRYHPQQDSYGIEQICSALEPLGLVAYVACCSSDNGGLHLYFPFEAPQSSQRVGHGVAATLQQAGIALAPGHLELFPNPKPYSSGLTLFNGHRLPLQQGSYLLNADFQPIWSSQERFVAQWYSSAAQNDLTAAALRKALKQQRRQYVVSGKANKFLNDLNAEIEPGWTGPSQTNHLLGRIALRSYVFGHVLSGQPPLTGQALADNVVAIARALPGYDDWCQHQDEIEQRAEDWARCVEGSKYYPYGFSKPLEEPLEQRDWNGEQFSKTAEKIKAAVEDLSQKGLPSTTTARFKALLTYGIGGGSLYRHKELWHPDYSSEPIEASSDRQSTETLVEVEEELDLSQADSDIPAGVSTPESSTSLFPPLGGNPGLRQGCDLLSLLKNGGNSSLDWGLALELKLRPQMHYQACFLRQWRSRQRVSTG